MRRCGVVCSALLLVAGCATGGGASSSGAVDIDPSHSATTVAATTRSTADAIDPGATGSVPQPAPARASILVVNDHGVFQIDAAGAITHLLDHPVAYAVDDTRGGLLYQLDRGRDWEDFSGDPTPNFSTEVWWIPAGAATPQALLVPTPGSGHTLTLYDAVATETAFSVVYLRHEGEEPPLDGTMADTLRLYDTATGSVTELARVRGWEWNLGEVSAGAGLVAATESQMLGHGCRLFDTASGSTTRTGVPSATAACFDESQDCAASCALSADGAAVVHDRLRSDDQGLQWAVTAAEVATGCEIGALTVAVSERWGPAELDIAGREVLLNRAWEGDYHLAALLVDLSESAPVPGELPLVGRARFATAPVTIATPAGIGTDAPDYYRYGEDGLFRVEDGVETRLRERAVSQAWDDHAGGVVFTGDDPLDIAHLPAGAAEPLLIEPSASYAYAEFTGVVAGRPSLLFAGVPADVDLDVWQCEGWACTSRDLSSGEEQHHLCLLSKIAVVDLVSGETVWSLEVSADEMLTDFDGRHVVAHRDGQGVIHDTFMGVAPIVVAGGVVLMRHALASQGG